MFVYHIIMSVIKEWILCAALTQHPLAANIKVVGVGQLSAF